MESVQSISISTGCTVAQHCCKGDQPFQWENPKFDPPYIPNPLIFPNQNLHRWLRPAYLLMCKIWWKYVCRGLPHKIGEIGLWRFRDFLCLSFPSFSFFFLPSSTGKTTEPFLTHDSSYDAVSRKKVPFGVTKFKFNILTYFFTKIWKITMAPMGKIRHCLKLS